MINLPKCPVCISDSIIHSDIIDVPTHRFYIICPCCGLRSPFVTKGILDSVEDIEKRLLYFWQNIKYCEGK